MWRKRETLGGVIWHVQHRRASCEIGLRWLRMVGQDVQRNAARSCGLGNSRATSGSIAQAIGRRPEGRDFMNVYDLPEDTGLHLFDSAKETEVTIFEKLSSMRTVAIPAHWLCRVLQMPQIWCCLTGLEGCEWWWTSGDDQGYYDYDYIWYTVIKTLRPNIEKYVQLQINRYVHITVSVGFMYIGNHLSRWKRDLDTNSGQSFRHPVTRTFDLSASKLPKSIGHVNCA